MFCPMIILEAVTKKGPVGQYNLKSGSLLRLRSLDYPRPYGDNAFYFWGFQSEPGTRIAAQIIDLDTEENYDWLEVGNGNDPNLREETRITRYAAIHYSLQAGMSSIFPQAFLPVWWICNCIKCLFKG